MTASSVVQRIVGLYPYVSYSPPLTASAVLGVGIWFTSWGLVSIGSASLVYQLWGFAYKHQVAQRVNLEQQKTYDAKTTV